MTVSIRWTSVVENRRKVLELYRGAELLRMKDIAAKLETSQHNVQHVIKTYMPEAERKAQKALRYSERKKGALNPMWGKKGAQHHNWIGECEDGYGYLTCLHEGKRRFVHRVVMAEVLGLSTLPVTLNVHHIDGDKKNNALDNLALVTPKGHQAIHFLQVKDSLSVALKRSTMAEVLKSMT